jgi:hypothetical protein
MITLNWICLQIGARENYAIRRALQRHDLLQHLLTDSWVPPGSVTVRKDDAPAATQASTTILAASLPFSDGGGLIQTTSG